MAFQSSEHLYTKPLYILVIVPVIVKLYSEKIMRKAVELDEAKRNIISLIFHFPVPTDSVILVHLTADVLPISSPFSDKTSTVELESPEG